MVQEEPKVIASDVPVYFNKTASDMLETSLYNGLEIAPDIFKQLFDHQIAGINFLYDNFKNKNGCILADDMGLGKTV